MQNNIDKVVEVLNSGGVVIFPTDTVYGIGCKLDHPKAIQKVFTIRKRPLEKAMLIVVDSIAMAKRYIQPIPKKVLALMHAYWPGGLTIILPCLINKVPAVARADGLTIAIRQTNHPILVNILKQIQVPLIAPSANFAGEKTPTSFEELDPRLTVLVEYVIQGECGGNTPSTIIDCSKEKWKIIRQGEVKVDI